MRRSRGLGDVYKRQDLLKCSFCRVYLPVFIETDLGIIVTESVGGSMAS
jgi:hypothetical protein